MHGVAFAFASAAPPSDVCSWWIMAFVQAGHSLHDDFDKLEKGFEDPYTHETYDLSKVLASFLESIFIDKAALNGTRPNAPLGVRPATTGAGLGRHAVPRRRSGASRFGPRRHGPEAHAEGNRGRRLRGRVDGVPRPPMPSRADAPSSRPPAALINWALSRPAQTVQGSTLSLNGGPKTLADPVHYTHTRARTHAHTHTHTHAHTLIVTTKGESKFRCRV